MTLHLKKALFRNCVFNSIVCAALAAILIPLLGAPGGMLWPAILVVGVGLATFLRTASRIRQGLLSRVQELASYVHIDRASAQARKQVDWSLIDDYATQLATRGFRPLGDYTTYPSAPTLAGVAAMFTDAEGSMIIEIQQLKLMPEAGKTDGIYFSIMSMVGGSIRVVTSNHKPMAVTYMMRGEHDVATARPGSGLMELLATHTDLLMRLREKVGKAPSTGLTVERYLLAIREAQAQARSRLSAMSGYAIACAVDRFDAERLLRWTPQIADLKDVPQRRLEELDNGFGSDIQPPIFHESLATQF
ncbi:MULTISPECIES: hypothetical protein [unclassified Duganella]|uniref:hypothetical protein n=1 Tax=unclassified Duganella TaxID=2636909 RepID=UPI000700F118|nr:MULTISPECIES: hypothetical protein [unclassified Duganella]KQV61859.1 hypothetical protein ASD07_03270 [Duganella sp. Root336D2]KRB84368.1 hypothetical protein ASE26_09945 [Duganella sp. Root198D2]